MVSGMLAQEDMLPTLLVPSMLQSVRLKLNQRLCMVLMVILVLVMVFLMLLTLLESMVLPLLPSPQSMELMLELEDMLPTLPVLSMLPSVRLKLNQRLCMVLMVTMLMDLVLVTPLLDMVMVMVMDLDIPTIDMESALLNLPLLKQLSLPSNLTPAMQSSTQSVTRHILYQCLDKKK